MEEDMEAVSTVEGIVEDMEVTLEGITEEDPIMVHTTAADTMLTDMVPFGFPAIGRRFVILWVADRSG